jgi:hypothetical protein
VLLQADAFGLSKAACWYIIEDMKLHTVIKAKPFDWALRLWPLGFSLAVLAVVWDLLEGDTP